MRRANELLAGSDEWLKDETAQCRLQALRGFKVAFKHMAELERKVFDKKSHFLQREAGQMVEGGPLDRDAIDTLPLTGPGDHHLLSVCQRNTYTIMNQSHVRHP